MNLNARGETCAGNAGSGVWVNGQQIRSGPAGFPAWLSEDRLVYNAFDGTLRSCDRFGSAEQQEDAHGGAPVLAGGGWFAAFTPQNGVRASWGLVLPDAAPVTMSPDGALFVTTYQNPVEIRAYRPHTYEPAYTITDARPLLNLGTTHGHAHALSGGQILWIDQSRRLRASGFPSPPAQVDEGAYEPTVLEPLPGVYWLCYSTQSGRNVAHPFDRSDVGYVVANGWYGFTGWCPLRAVMEFCGAGNLGEVGPITRRQLIAADPQDLEPLPPAPAPPNPGPSPVPAPPNPAPIPPAPSPVHLDFTGVILMSQISGVLHYFGKKDLGSGKAALYADAGKHTVFSAQGDTRASNAIGAWETFKLDGAIATASDGSFHSYVAIDVTGLV